MSVIDKIAWILVRDRKALFLRSKGKVQFFNAGGKRKDGETDAEALQRELYEELGVRLLVSTLQYLETFGAPVPDKPGMEVCITCYAGEVEGEMSPCSEIEEIGWLGSHDRDCTTPAGKLILDWLKKQDLID